MDRSSPVKSYCSRALIIYYIQSLTLRVKWNYYNAKANQAASHQ